jgi:hypothetical protein
VPQVGNQSLAHSFWGTFKIQTLTKTTISALLITEWKHQPITSGTDDTNNIKLPAMGKI